MEKMTENEPAMPAVNAGNDQPSFYEKGLTIRQHFAAIALQGLLSNHLMVDTLSKQAQDVITQEAVFYADALIAELNKP